MAEKGLQRFFALVAVLALVLGLVSTGQVSAQDSTPRPELPKHDTLRQQADLSLVTPMIQQGGTAKVVVILQQPSLVSLAVQSREAGAQMALADAQSHLASIQRAQDTLQAQLEAPQVGGTTLFKNQRVYNGIALKVDASKLVNIAALPGVAAVVPLETHTVENAYAADLIGAKDVWNSLATDLSYTGRGVSVAVIDTGIDFLHRNFGGDANYEEAAADTDDFTTEDPGVFPTGKVLGGWDFAGDGYNANDPATDTPSPDPIPMDCNGHGSHVAGSVAGYGVTNDGETYMGDYTAALDTMAMRIGPGMAPQADLYALRVFGCEGSTNLTDKAIEWAIDPNGDGDLSDAVDIINMSLGSDFGAQESSSTIAAGAAVEYGVIVVASAGNSGDTSYITGSPAVAARVINVAATMDAFNVMDGFIVNSPASVAGNKPGSSAVAWPTTIPTVTGDLKYPTDLPNNVNGCAAFPANYFAGKIALLDWTLPQQCGSVARANNATTAGAIGVLMIYQVPILDISITGSSLVPSMITTQAVGNPIKALVVAGQTVNVTLTNELNGTIKVVDPGLNDLVGTFTSRGPSLGNGSLKPDLAAPGVSIFSTASGRTLGTAGIEYGTGEDGVSFNGTSMAAPIVAGSMAILREQHPDWTAEELKALVMNTATNDVYSGYNKTGPVFSPVRVGAGRIDVVNATSNEVIVYNDMVPGAVSVSFGAVEVSTVYKESITVVMENKGQQSVTYSVAYRPATNNPGVEFALMDISGAPLTSLTVPPGGSRRFRVEMTATAANLRNVRDAAIEVVQATMYGNLERIWLSDESGLIEFTGAGLTKLRLPVHVVASPVSNMHSVSRTFRTTKNATGTVNIQLTGTGVDTTGRTFTGYPEAITSLVSVFELGTTSERLPVSSRFDTMADLRAVGVYTDAPIVEEWADTYVYFGIATYEEWNTPSEAEFDVYLDTNQDGSPEYILYSAPLLTAGRDATDVLMTFLYDVGAGTSTPQDYINLDNGTGASSALLNNSVMVMPAYAADFGLTETAGTFNWAVVTWSAQTGAMVDSTDWMTYDAANPTLILPAGAGGTMPTFFDLPGATIPVQYDRTGPNANTELNGVLLLHHHNEEGNRVELLLGRPLFMPIAGR